jgi:hypothetical protein|nr:MAG TPA: hypothetical protein [Caudoviricetes sp.]
MLVITVHVNAPPGQAIGIKEQIAQDLERYGDTRVVSVEVVQPAYRQMQIGEIGNRPHGKK